VHATKVATGHALAAEAGGRLLFAGLLSGSMGPAVHRWSGVIEAQIHKGGARRINADQNCGNRAIGNRDGRDVRGAVDSGPHWILPCEHQRTVRELK
jgi:hypothetical protein